MHVLEGLNTYVVMATNVCTCSKNRVYKYSVVSTCLQHTCCEATVRRSGSNCRYSDEVRNNFHVTLDWLHEHACSRSYGLGKLLE